MEHDYGPVEITVVVISTVLSVIGCTDVVSTEDPDDPFTFTAEGLTDIDGEVPEITVVVEGWTEIGETEVVGSTGFRLLVGTGSTVVVGMMVGVCTPGNTDTASIESGFT